METIHQRISEKIEEPERMPPALCGFSNLRHPPALLRPNPGAESRGRPVCRQAAPGCAIFGGGERRKSRSEYREGQQGQAGNTAA